MRKIVGISLVTMGLLMGNHVVNATTSEVKSLEKKITIISDDGELYKDSKLNESISLKKGSVYEVNGYRIINGKKYYRVYQDTKYKGYIYEKRSKDLKATPMNKDIKYISQLNKNLWNNFYWNNKRGITKKDEVFYSKYEYELGDGKKYYSVYQKNNQNKEIWRGYIYSKSLSSLNATKFVSQAVGKSESTIYTDLYFNPSSTKLKKGETYQIKRYYTLNGKKYYSIYQKVNNEEKWLGYVSEDNMILRANPNNEQEVNQAYAQGTDTGASTLEAKVNKVDSVTEETIRGMDLTVYQAQKSANVQYKDFEGNILNDESFMKFIKENGVNTVQLKVVVNPKDDKGKYYGGGNPTLSNALKTAKLATEVGLKVNINLIYSDFYTSKDNQSLPKGWTKENASEKAVTYTKEVIEQLKEINPYMITIGSNMNDNFLSLETTKANEVLKEVTTEIRNELSNTKIVLSYASPYKDWYWNITKRLKDAGVIFDVIGADIFPAWNKLDDIKGAKESVNSLNKKFMITSVSYPFTEQDSDGHSNGNTAYDILNQKVGSVSPQGQSSYLQKLFETITPNNASDGAGVIYDNAIWIAVKAGNKVNATYNKTMSEKYGTGWATSYAKDYVSGADKYYGASAVDNQALFDDLGNPLQSLKVFSQVMNGTDGKEDVLPENDPFATGMETGLKNQPANINKVKNMASNSIRGVDISSYQALRDAGVKFYDENGKEESLLKVLKDYGVNYIRLRIWNDPKADKDMEYEYNHKKYVIKAGDTYGGGNCDSQTMLKIAKEASKYDMKVLLDFHYSDFWADPSNQILPKKWKNLNDDELQQSIYKFTKDTVETYVKAGVDVGMVQIGNEITKGMMGIHSDNWKDIWENKEKSSRINAYLKQGIKAVKRVAPDALINLHLDSAELERYDAITKTWKRDGVDYDVLGLSSYEFWEAKNFKTIQNKAAEDGKMFAIMETSWPNTLKEGDGTTNTIGTTRPLSAYSVSVQGQVNQLESIYTKVLSQPNGLGVFYWEPAWIPVKPGWNYWQENIEIANQKGTGWASQGALGYLPNSELFYEGKPTWGGSSWDNQALFDPHGYPLKSLAFYKESIENNQKVSTVQLKFVDISGKKIAPSKFIRINNGESQTVNLPKVSGYTSKFGDSMTIKGERDYQTEEITYLKPQYISQYVTVSKEGYNIWKDLSYKEIAEDNSYHHTYLAKNKVTLKNGNTYYELYGINDKSIGWINEDALKVGKGEQGAGFSCNGLITLSNANYKVLKNFNWENQAIQRTGRIFTVKYQYYHMNGSVYYSLYNMDNDWVGYINVKGTSQAEISALKEINKAGTLLKDSNCYNNSHLETIHKISSKDTYEIAGVRTINGQQYYKIYKNRCYIGYVLASNIKVK